MASLFKNAAGKVKSSPFVIPIFIVFVVMLLISVGVMIEDVMTSYAGYTLMPTRKINDWVSWLVALIPSVGTVGFFYMYADDTNKRWARSATLLLWLVDISTDVWYKASYATTETWWYVYPLAFGESFVIFTLGSELMATSALGMLIALAPDFFGQIVNLSRRVGDTGFFDGIARAAKGQVIADDDDDDDIDDRATDIAMAAMMRQRRDEPRPQQVPQARPQSGFGALDAAAKEARDGRR